MTHTTSAKGGRKPMKSQSTITRNVCLRQGDVLLQAVAALPADCAEVAPEHGRIVLAYGEATGHAHAIELAPAAAAEIAEAAIARARLWRAPGGERYLVVAEPVALVHEEHSTHTIAPGIYRLPVQVEYRPEELRRVQD